MDAKLKQHLLHPLYAKAAQAWLDTHRRQIEKGAEKYPEPLNHKSWTAAELIDHARQENVDQNNYLTALDLKIHEMVCDIDCLSTYIEAHRDKLSYDDHSIIGNTIRKYKKDAL